MVTHDQIHHSKSVTIVIASQERLTYRLIQTSYEYHRKRVIV